MESVLGRYRNLTILVGVLFLQVLGLAVQVKRSGDAEHTRLIRIWAVDAITPFERAFVSLQNRADDLWKSYFFLRGVRAENRQLKQQIEEMRLEQVRLSEDAAQARRLQALLGFKEQVIGKPLPAQVIGSSGSDLSRSIYIDKGSNDGVAQDMAVITANGIVGKVLRVYPSTSLVLMINDQSSGVGVLLEKSRLQGVLRGTLTGELSLDRVMSDEQVFPGEVVLSSGGDQIFPKGLPVGMVTHVSPGHDLFLNIKVKPTADLNRLEEVLVVTEQQESQPVADKATRVRAADILAQRLPSVPDKPPATVAGAIASANSAATHAGAPASAKLPTNATAKPLAGTTASTARVSPAPTSGTSQNSVSGHAVAGTPATPDTTGAPKNQVSLMPAAQSNTENLTSARPKKSTPAAEAAQPRGSSAQSTPRSPDSEDTPH
jgi:rod shape-determining protein MreC